jgi:hypothetical protein
VGLAGLAGLAGLPDLHQYPLGLDEGGGVDFRFRRICTTVHWAAAIERALNRRIHLRAASESPRTLKMVVHFSTFRENAPPFSIISIPYSLFSFPFFHS